MRKKTETPDTEPMKYLLQDISYMEKVIGRSGLSQEERDFYKKRKEGALKELIDMKHPYSICGGNGKRYHTRVPNGKQIYATKLDDLYEKLFLFYFENGAVTVNELFKPYIEWKIKRRNPSWNTIYKEENAFKKYIKDSELGKMKIKDVRREHIETFFFQHNKKIKSKELKNLKTVTNGIFEYAVTKEIIDTNYSKEFSVHDVKTLSEISSQTGYTDEERIAILNALEGNRNIYDLSITFMFCMCIRIGELRALRWCDIIGNDEKILIHRQIVAKKDKSGKKHFVEVDYTKTGHNSGIRAFPLGKRAKKVLEIIRTEYGEQEYLFTGKNKKPIYETPLRKHLWDACEKAGVRYRSSHKIRFWAASAMASRGASLQEMMRMGGWSDKNTALHYIMENRAAEVAEKTFNDI